MANPLQQASDPKTSPRQLRSLSTHKSREVRAAVAANGGATLATLLSLLNEFPEQVLGNAAMMLHQIENPALFREADDELQQQWAGNAAAPVWLLEELGGSENDEVRAALAANPSTPAELLERLAFPEDFPSESEDAEWLEPRTEVIDNPNAPPGLRFDVALNLPEPDLEFDDPPSEEVRTLLLQDPSETNEYNEFYDSPWDDLSTEQVWSAELGDDDDEAWASLLYRDPTGAYVMAWGGDGVYGGLREPEDLDDEEPEQLPGGEWAMIWGGTCDELADNPATPWSVLRGLVWHAHEGVRRGVLSHPEIPAELLAQFARDPEPRVRLAVAGHPSTPRSLLAELARAPEPRVRLAAATNPSTPAEALALLATDDSASIRLAVARNGATSAATLTRLRRDHRASVRRAAEVSACRLGETGPRWGSEPAVSSAA